MTKAEILSAAKEAGCQAKTDGFIVYRNEPVGNMLERFATIIERKTIERCAVTADEIGDTDNGFGCAAAIRKLGEQ